jgi:hypothetical protein
VRVCDGAAEFVEFGSCAGRMWLGLGRAMIFAELAGVLTLLLLFLELLLRQAPGVLCGLDNLVQGVWRRDRCLLLCCVDWDLGLGG